MYLVRGSGGYGQPVTAVRFSIGLSSQSHPGRTVSRAEETDFRLVHSLFPIIICVKFE
ncbi:BnaA09g03320D [Brassica napus]|uniref:BnaA09g03320D protein n=1 Tax=Brassica napus TaxID=3708 RepID=A0A078II06_BRANA|nr:BnaA09g03320D [Brassica napus]